MSPYVSEFVCVNCQASYGVDATEWKTCTSCGPALGILDVRYDLARVENAWTKRPLSGRAQTHWRYKELLPLEPESIRAEWTVGWTPLIDAPRLASELCLESVCFKDEGRNPTASFKDRASSVGVCHALQQGASTIACASTGNAATSLAGHAALAGLRAVIFVPATAPEPKLAQLLVYGATVVAVEGSYEEAYQMCSSACSQMDWYNRNCAINPVLVEGKKTAGLEIAEQSTQHGGMPDWVAVSVGDGCTIAGIWKGLREMYELGRVEKLPRLLAVQAKSVAPIQYAWQNDFLPAPTTASTIADSIDVPVPRNWRKAVNAVRESEGQVVTVADDEILSAIRLAGTHGVFAEPAAAAALAGVVRAVNDGTIKSKESVLSMVTGSGLKDTRAAIQAGGSPIRIPPDLELLRQSLDDHGDMNR